MYSVIAQRDSFSNLSIAKAAKEDSEIMKLIGLLTTVFLPATFISVGHNTKSRVIFGYDANQVILLDDVRNELLRF